MKGAGHQRRKTGRNASSGSAAAALFCGALLFLTAVCAAAPTPPAIPENDIRNLQEELALSMEAESSSVEARRACKSVIRTAETLLQASPEAPNRYDVLAVLFQARKKLLSLEATLRNRQAIFETSEKLLNAPDEYAATRFEAEMLLSERDLALSKATVAERIEALKKILRRYRGTEAEWKSLMIASLIAPKLLAFDLEEQIQTTMHERFGGDHEALAFRRREEAIARLDAVFSGTYKSAEGSEITFPHDRMGHQFLVLFWSKANPDSEPFLAKVKEQQERFPGRFELYSFNLDELPDAGRAILEKAGLTGTPMHLPGGRTSSAYLAYARTDPVALLVNAQGHTCLQREKPLPWPPPTPARGNRPASAGPGLGMWLDDGRYTAQLRSLFIGDFLVAGLAADSLPAETFKAIRACFTPPPLRYRLSVEESLANYRRAEKLCRELIQAHPESADLWVVQSHRIVALLGMWNLARAPEHLAEAVKEAQGMLDTDLPPGADVIPRFCLAKQALRNGETDPERLLPALLEAAGGEDASASALAAAAVLAIEANAGTVYADCRDRLLGSAEAAPPALWPVIAFLRDRHHQHRLFWGNPGRYGHTRLQRYKVRQLISGVAQPQTGKRLCQAEFETLDGDRFRVPEDTGGAITGIVFAEPPGDESAGGELAARVSSMAKEFTSRGVKVIVAHLSEDTASVRALVQQSEDEARHVLVPGGPRNPLVQRLGLLSADRIPNLFLLRPDGTVAWAVSGLSYPVNGSSVDHAMTEAIGINILKFWTDAAFAALDSGRFQEALDRFAALLDSEQRNDWWAAARLQGRALAYTGLQNWESALAEIDAAIEKRLADFGSTTPCACHGVIDMRLTRAFILEKLGRHREAENERRLAADPRTAPHQVFPHGIERQGVPMGVYYDWLQRIRLKLTEKENR